MVAQRLNLTGDKRIEQGSLFELAMKINGDYRLWVAQGQVRDKVQGTLLAQFSFTPWVFDGTSSGCIIHLSSSVTSAMPPSQLSKTRNRDTQLFTYDIELVPPSGSTIRILEGDVEVSPEVTLP